MEVDELFKKYFNQDLEAELRKAIQDAAVFGQGKIRVPNLVEPRDYDLDMGCGTYGDEG